MLVTVDRAAGVAVLERGGWRHVVPLADLPRWRDMARDLRARGAPKPAKGQAPALRGPWARFYEAEVVALERACREMEG